MILLKMFIAILDGQFTDLNSGKSDPSGIDKMGFFELIIFLLKNNIDGMIAKVEKFTEEKKDDEEDEDPNKKKKKKHFAERAIKYLTKKLLSLIKLIKSILLGSELGEDEKNRLKKAKEKNVMNVKLKYVKNVEEEKKREENLDGLEYYIKGGVIPQKKKDEDEDADIMEGKNNSIKFIYQRMQIMSTLIFWTMKNLSLTNG